MNAGRNAEDVLAELASRGKADADWRGGRVF